MNVRELTLKEFNLLPDAIYNKIEGKFVLESEGKNYYGLHSAEDAYQAVKPQKTVIYKKIIN